LCFMGKKKKKVTFSPGFELGTFNNIKHSLYPLG